MTNTENYNLNKPESTDFYNVENFNENMNIIDAELKKQNDNVDSLSVVVNIAQETAETAQKTADTATAISKGKNQAEVFDTTEDMYAWLADETNKGVKSIGDNLYIRDTGVPDWWIASILDEPNEDGYYYEIAQLETQKVDLTPLDNAIDNLEGEVDSIKEYIGKSKNLLNHDALSQSTTTGLMITVNADKSITVNGTPTADTTFNVVSSLYQEFTENIIISGCPAGGSKETYCVKVQMYDTSGSIFNYYDTGEGISCEADADNPALLVSYAIKIASGVTVDNLTFYPMVRLASEENDTYEPYREDRINSRMPTAFYEIITRDDITAALANTLTQIGAMTAPAHSMMMLTISVNNATVNPDFKLGLTLNSTEEEQIRWGAWHKSAKQYCSYETTINIPNATDNDLPLYAWIQSSINIQIRYIFLMGISVPMAT